MNPVVTPTKVASVKTQLGWGVVKAAGSPSAYYSVYQSATLSVLEAMLLLDSSLLPVDECFMFSDSF